MHESHRTSILLSQSGSRKSEGFSSRIKINKSCVAVADVE